MTDHLEPYRRMARSIRFFPPSALAQPIVQPVAAKSVVDSWVQTSSNADVKSIEPPLDLSKHAAALVREAVCKPTVLPATYVIPENIGDRISRLVASSNLATIKPNFSQPAPNDTAVHNGETFENTSDRLVYDPWQQVYALESTIVAPEAIAQEPVVVTEAIEAPETIVEEPVTVTAEVTEVPEIIVEEPVTVTAEVTEVPETIVEEPVTVTAEVTEVPETIVEEPVTVTAEVTEVPETIVDADNSITEVDSEAQAPTLLEKVSSVIDAVSTAFMNPESVRKTEAVEEPASSTPEAIATPVQDNEELLTTEVTATEAEAEVEPAPAPSLLERVSAVVEVVTTTLKNPEAIASTPTAPAKAPETKPLAAACPACGSTELRKNGRRQGKQRYACKDCGRQFAMADALKAEEQPAAPTPTMAEEQPQPPEIAIEATTVNKPQTDAEMAEKSDAAHATKSGGKKKKAKGFGASKKSR